MTNFSFRIPAKIKIFTNSPIQSIVKSIDNYITPATTEQFISSNYTTEKAQSLQSYYDLYHACDDNELKLVVIQDMSKDGFIVEAMDLYDLNHKNFNLFSYLFK